MCGVRACARAHTQTHTDARGAVWGWAIGRRRGTTESENKKGVRGEKRRSMASLSRPARSPALFFFCCRAAPTHARTLYAPGDLGVRDHHHRTAMAPKDEVRQGEKTLARRGRERYRAVDLAASRRRCKKTRPPTPRPTPLLPPRPHPRARRTPCSRTGIAKNAIRLLNPAKMTLTILSLPPPSTHKRRAPPTSPAATCCSSCRRRPRPGGRRTGCLRRTRRRVRIGMRERER